MFEQIKAASQSLIGHANQTPVFTSSTLDNQLNANLFFKCENFQKVGAFKFRGAFNSISQLSSQEKEKGVIAYSSGNHAQAIACVGHMLGVKTTIVMPSDAPSIKLAATRGYGAQVITYNPQTQTRESVAEEILQQNDLTLIPPFDHPNVIAGQGTVAYEFFQSHPQLSTIIAPCGGGGLLSGTAIAAKHMNPECQVVGVEPELANDATLSFQTGKLHVKPNPPTIADGTRTASLGGLTFPIILQNVDQMVTVTEAAIKEAVRFFFARMKMVVEPSGALGLAALMSGAIKPKGNIGVIISGGNIDSKTMAEILTEH
ncbi:threo-3-hydroxy-L-aspartate ammonia-lyase [Aliikangiella sp. IMCC44359]|uniref:threo-3-hydroxy-L-aspartate ammonia-lyase n=1 Tax=Aliikangiella sp. IMCC44359 TaxID=3459125 RepID=UPI00403AC763